MAETHHLQKRGNAWHYYRRVPTALVPLVGKAFVKKSLGTSDLKQAKILRNALNVQIDAEFAAAEVQGTDTPPVPMSLAVLTEHLRQHIKGLDQRSAASLAADPPESEVERAERLKDVGFDLHVLKDRDDPNGDRWVTSVFDKVLVQAGASLSHKEAVAGFAEIVRRGLMELQHRRLDRLQDDHSARPHDPLFDTQKAPPMTRRALEGEVLKLVINADPAQPWRGRSPWQMMGLSPTLMAEIEKAVSNATAYTGKGLLPMPSAINEEQQQKAAIGLQSSSLAVVSSKADYAHQTGGRESEFRRVDLTPDLQKADLNLFTSDLHYRLLAGCGIPPALVTANGNAGAMREGYRLFALQTVLPLARQCQPELSRKIGVETVSIAQMMSADVAGRARAVGVLVGAGVPLADAMKYAGWGEAYE